MHTLLGKKPSRWCPRSLPRYEVCSWRSASCQKVGSHRFSQKLPDRKIRTVAAKYHFVVRKSIIYFHKGHFFPRIMAPLPVQFRKSYRDQGWITGRELFTFLHLSPAEVDKNFSTSLWLYWFIRLSHVWNSSILFAWYLLIFLNYTFPKISSVPIVSLLYILNTTCLSSLILMFWRSFRATYWSDSGQPVLFNFTFAKTSEHCGTF